MSVRARLCGWLWVSWAGAVFACQAGELPVVAVVGMHQAGLDTAAHEAAAVRIAEALEASGKVHALSAAGLARALAGREEVVLSEALLAPGRRALLEGRNLYNQADPEGAIPLLERAIGALELGMAGSNSARDLWEAQVLLGHCRLQLGDESGARRALAAAAALAPARSPSPALFPPDLLSAWELARDAGLEHAGGLSLSVGQASAQLWLDGDPLGAAPAQAERVLPGVHYVVARGDGLAGYARVDVHGQGVVEPLTLSLSAPTLGAPEASKAGRQRQAADLYRALGTHVSGADFVLLAGVEGGTLSLQLYAKVSDTFSRPVEVPVQGAGDDEAALSAPLLLNVLGADGKLDTSSAVAQAVPLDLSANPLLAGLLTQPRPAVSVAGADREKKGVKWWAVAVPVVLVGGGAAAAGVVLGSKQVEVDQGTVVIGPF